jgi:phage tail-like protein
MTSQTAPSPSPQPAAAPDRLFHVADATHRHPGEAITFHTCLRAGAAQPGRRVTVSLPKGCSLQSCEPQAGGAVGGWGVREAPEGLVLEWALADDLPAGAEVEFAVHARVLPASWDLTLKCEAALLDESGQELDGEAAWVRVAARSSYMAYLPEIYHENDFLNRLLMLFESFWTPVAGQIEQSDAYYDVQLTPAEFLPWMASWIGITWDESLPEERKRDLLHSAVGLYQSRGTRQALLEYLTLYTHGEVEIVEHRAQNFVLGRSAPLGRTIALGRTNLPHSFSVTVRVGRGELSRRLGEPQPNAERLFRQRLETIIAAQKPAHTTFDLRLQIDDEPPTPQKGSDHGQ